MTDSLPRLRPGSPIGEAAAHFHEYLERIRRPRNTVDSYQYDLRILTRDLPAKSVNQITADDISHYLASANSTATRKRRLTTLRQFYRFLIEEARVLSVDPTADIYPNRIELRTPTPLNDEEQERLLAAAAEDEPWSLTAILLMMRVGLNRSEVLALERGNVDRMDPAVYFIQVESDDIRKPARTRRLDAYPPFPAAYEQFLERVNPDGKLFPVGFQAINGMVGRVRRKAKLTRLVTPRALRETFIADRLRKGVSEDDLLRELGMATDLRNRQSIRRFKPAGNQDPAAAS